MTRERSQIKQERGSTMQLKPFEFKSNEVRTTVIDGVIWFVAKDVCSILDIGNHRQAVTRLDDDEIGVISNDTNKGSREMIAVNESGLYGLVLSSRKPEAREFQRWIRKEVIPAIRKHGGYLTPSKIEDLLDNPDTIIQMATRLKEEREKRLALEQKAKENEPKVLFSTAVEASRTSILIGQLAKLIKQNGVDIGQNKLFGWLRENGYLISQKGRNWNEPTQNSMESELFEVKERVVPNPDGSQMITRTTMVTGKGQVYFINKFLNSLKCE